MNVRSAVTGVVGAAVLAASAWLWLGSGPSSDASIAVSDFTRYVFVPDRAAPAVAVIDGFEDRLIGRIELDAFPVQALVSAETGLLIVAGAEQDRLNLYDLLNGRPVAPLPIGFVPAGVVLSPDSYLAAAFSEEKLTIVSLRSREPLVEVRGLERPAAATFSEDGSQLYVTQAGSGEVAIVSVLRGEVIERIAVTEAGGLTALTRTPDGQTGIVAAEGGTDAVLIDLNEALVLGRLRVGRGPRRPFGTSYGQYMLVPSSDDRSVAMISMDTRDVVARFAAADDIVSVNTGWFETTAVALDRAGKSAFIYDLEDRRLVAELALAGTPGPGVVTPDGTKLFAALEDIGAVAVIHLGERRLATVINHVGERPSGAVMGLSNNYCH